MTRYALVEPGGRIAQIEIDIFEIAPPYEWIECPKKVDESYIYTEGKFVDPAKQELDKS